MCHVRAEQKGSLHVKGSRCSRRAGVERHVVSSGRIVAFRLIEHLLRHSQSDATSTAPAASTASATPAASLAHVHHYARAHPPPERR